MQNIGSAGKVTLHNIKDGKFLAIDAFNKDIQIVLTKQERIKVKLHHVEPQPNEESQSLSPVHEAHEGGIITLFTVSCEKEEYYLIPKDATVCINKEKVSSKTALKNGHVIEVEQQILRFSNLIGQKQHRRLPPTPGVASSDRPPPKPQRQHLLNSPSLLEEDNVRSDEVLDTISLSDSDIEEQIKQGNEKVCDLASAYINRQLLLHTDFMSSFTPQLVDQIFQTIQNADEAILLDFVISYQKTMQKVSDSDPDESCHYLVIKLLVHLLRFSLEPLDDINVFFQLLTIFSRLPQNLPWFISCQATPTILGTMTAYSHNALVQQMGCTILAQLTTYMPSQNEKAPLRETGIDLLLTAIENHSNNVDVIRPACRALANLTHTFIQCHAEYTGEDGKVYADLIDYLSCEALPDVNQVMIRYPQDVGVQSEGSRLMRCFTIQPKDFTRSSSVEESNEEMNSTSNIVQVTKELKWVQTTASETPKNCAKDNARELKKIPAKNTDNIEASSEENAKLCIGVENNISDVKDEQRITGEQSPVSVSNETEKGNTAEGGINIKSVENSSNGETKEDGKSSKTITIDLNQNAEGEILPDIMPGNVPPKKPPRTVQIDLNRGEAELKWDCAIEESQNIESSESWLVSSSDDSVQSIQSTAREYGNGVANSLHVKVEESMLSTTASSSISPDSIPDATSPKSLWRDVHTPDVASLLAVRLTEMSDSLTSDDMNMIQSMVVPTYGGLLLEDTRSSSEPPQLSNPMGCMVRSSSNQRGCQAKQGNRSSLGYLFDNPDVVSQSINFDQEDLMTPRVSEIPYTSTDSSSCQSSVEATPIATPIDPAHMWSSTPSPATQRRAWGNVFKPDPEKLIAAENQDQQQQEREEKSKENTSTVILEPEKSIRVEHQKICDILALRTMIINHICLLSKQGKTAHGLSLLDKPVKELRKEINGIEGVLENIAGTIDGDHTLMEIDPAVIVNILDVTCQRGPKVKLAQRILEKAENLLEVSQEPYHVEVICACFQSLLQGPLANPIRHDDVLQKRILMQVDKLKSTITESDHKNRESLTHLQSFLQSIDLEG